MSGPLDWGIGGSGGFEGDRFSPGRDAAGCPSYLASENTTLFKSKAAKLISMANENHDCECHGPWLLISS